MPVAASEFHAAWATAQEVSRPRRHRKSSVSARPPNMAESITPATPPVHPVAVRIQDEAARGVKRALALGFVLSAVGPPGAALALEDGRAGALGEGEQVAFRLGRRHAGERPDLEERQRAPAHRGAGLRERFERPGHADVLARRAQGAPRVQRQPVLAAAVPAGLPATGGLEARDQREEVPRAGVQVRRQDADLVGELDEGVGVEGVGGRNRVRRRRPLAHHPRSSIGPRNHVAHVSLLDMPTIFRSSLVACFQYTRRDQADINTAGHVEVTALVAPRRWYRRARQRRLFPCSADDSPAARATSRPGASQLSVQRPIWRS